MNMIWYELFLSNNMMLFWNNNEFFIVYKTWCYLKITNTSHLKYIRYELNCFICLHENKIMRYSQSQWKILRKLLNQNHMLIHNHLYLKNIMIWLMFSHQKKYDIEIELKSEKILNFEFLYSMSWKKLQIL